MAKHMRQRAEPEVRGAHFKGAEPQAERDEAIPVASDAAPEAIPGAAAFSDSVPLLEVIPHAHAPKAPAHVRPREKKPLPRPTKPQLIAAAIVVAALVGVVGVWSHFARREARIAALDESAQALYQVVQASLAELKTSGQPDALENTLAAHHLTPLHTPPADFAQGASGLNLDLYHVGNAADEDADIASVYLLEDHDTDGYYVIEFAPAAYEAYAVFYWEKDARNPAGGDAASITYDDLLRFRTRDASERTPARIGYYASSDLAPAASELAGSALEVVNGEELYVRLVGERVAAIASDPQRLARLSIEVQVTGLSREDAKKSVTWARTFAGDEVPSEGGEVDVVLDSLAQESSFARVVDTIVPGENILVRATARYEGVVAATTSAETNSLFGGYDDETGTVRVSSVRHLNNLRASRRSANGARGTAIRRVELSGDLDFSGESWTDGALTPAARAVGNPLGAFEPLSAYDLSGVREFDGCGHEIRGLSVTSATENCGMFATGALTLRNLTLRDPVVHGTTAVGAFAGAWLSGSLENCHVVASEPGRASVEASRDVVGGLVGSLGPGAELRGCSSTANVTGGSEVGGLVGSVAEGAKLEDCAVGYAADPTVALPVVTDEPTVANAGANAVQPGGTAAVSGRKGDASLVAPFRTDQPVRVVGVGSAVGGAVGTTSGTSKGVRVLANVAGAERVGGFAGVLGGEAEGCEANSPLLRGVNTPDDPLADANCVVTASGGSAGGFAGEQHAAAKACRAHVDVVAQGDNVGGFSGLASAKSISCGVCGMTGAEAPGTRSDISSGRSARVGVQAGGNNVGGFVGLLTAGDLGGCFSSANVAHDAKGKAAGYNYGGLVGRQDAGGIEGCYASGDVVGRAAVGGLVGRELRGTCTDVYSTGVVIGESQVGGLIGSADALSQMSKAWSWALVYGTGAAGPNTSGGLVGQAGSGYVVYTECAYLAYPGYNDLLAPLTLQPPTFTRDELVAQAKGKALTAEQSHPVKEGLAGQAYPFAPLWYDGKPMEHYGNWA